MVTGTVKWFNNAKGFGFVVPDANSSEPSLATTKTEDVRDIFAHYSDIDMNGYKALKAGQLVTFEIHIGEKGEQAVNIRPISRVELDQYRDDKLSPTTDKSVMPHLPMGETSTNDGRIQRAKEHIMTENADML